MTQNIAKSTLRFASEVLHFPLGILRTTFSARFGVTGLLLHFASKFASNTLCFVVQFTHRALPFSKGSHSGCLNTSTVHCEIRSH